MNGAYFLLSYLIITAILLVAFAFEEEKGDNN